MYSLRRVILALGITLILLHASVDAKKAKKKKKTPIVKIKPDKPAKCTEVSEKDSSIKLRCGKKDVIYFITINSYYNSISCNDTAPGACSGLQPSVLTDSNLCYSMRTCMITFNNKAPIVKTNNATCIGKTPQSLRVSYKCVNKEIFYALYRNGQNLTLASERTSDYGMLVSHDTYPWHYIPGLIIDLTLKPEKKEKTKLYISVPVMELDSFGDVVRIGNDKDVDPVNQTKPGTAVLIAQSNGKAVVKFYTNNSSSTAKGFIICFYWAEETEQISGVDICSKLKKKRKKKGGKKKKNEGNGKAGKKERRKKGKKKRKKTKK